MDRDSRISELALNPMQERTGLGTEAAEAELAACGDDVKITLTVPRIQKKSTKSKTIWEFPPSTIHQASIRGDAEAFVNFVKNGGEDIIFKSLFFFEANSVHLACANNRVNILKIIAEEVCIGKPEMISKLFSKRNFLSMPPALVACRQGSTAALLYLVSLCQHGILDYAYVIDAKDIFGKSSMEWGISQKNPEIVEMILAVSIQRLIAECKGKSCARISSMLARFIEHHIEKGAHDTENGPDINLNEDFVHRLAVALAEDEENILYVLIQIKSMMLRSHYFRDLAEVISGYCKMLLDSAGNVKNNVKALVAPMETDKYLDAKEVLAISRELAQQDILCHEAILGLLFDKWDAVGAMGYFSRPITFVYASLVTVGMFVCAYVLMFAPIVILRPWAPALMRFSQKGRGKGVNESMAYDQPFMRWMCFQVLNFIFAILYAVLVFTLNPGSESLSALEVVLMVWSFSIILNELFELMEGGIVGYGADLWNICDVISSTFLFSFLSCRIASFSMEAADAVDLLTTATTILGVGGIFAVVRILSVLELNPTIGPLLWTLADVFSRDVPNFLTLITVVIAAFTVCFYAMYSSVCVQDVCMTYDNDWEFPWINRPESLFVFLVTISLSQNGNAGFSQKFFGLFLIILFSIIVITILLNVFIAMLSDSFTRVGESSQEEYRYSLACLVLKYKNSEAIFSPIVPFELASRVLRQMLGFVLPCLGPMETFEEPPLFEW